MSRGLLALSRAGLTAGVLAVMGTGCVRTARTTRVPEAEVAWIEAPVVGDVAGELERLEALGRAGAEARVVRLDRLLDRFDAARFGPDPFARESLWAALGGHRTGTGAAATRDALARLLDEALAIEQRAAEGDPLREGHAKFLTDAIMMLSADLERPTTADDLSSRNLAYRELAEHGHVRIADNAHFRLYDHARGTLEAAARAAPNDRLDVAVQALYSERDSVAALLADAAPHAKPPLPSAEALLAVVDRHREAIARDGRWLAITDARADEDASLHDTLAASLPAPREQAWAMPALSRGTGRPETLAPVVLARPGIVTVDAGRKTARSIRAEGDADELVRALDRVMAQDGRGVVLLVPDPLLPAPELATLLRGLRRAQTSRIELAVREPRLSGEGEVVVGLPVHVVRSADGTAGSMAVLQARVSVHLGGHGPRFAIDGRGLAPIEGPRELAEQVRALTRAYPRERVVRLTIEDDVAYPQLVELVAALSGGSEPAFAGVAWWAGGTAPALTAAGTQEAEAILARRAALHVERPGPRLEQPYPLAADDQKRLEAFAIEIHHCLPELELDRVADRAVEIELVFDGGRLEDATVRSPRGLHATHREALLACVHDQALALRLHEHRDRVTIVTTLGPS